MFNGLCFSCNMLKMVFFNVLIFIIILHKNTIKYNYVFAVFMPQLVFTIIIIKVYVKG